MDFAGNRIAKLMAGRKVHLHANHGVIVATQTIHECFDYLYYLERAAEVTIKAMSSGKPLKLIDEDVLQQTCKIFKDSGVAAEVGCHSINQSISYCAFTAIGTQQGAIQTT